ncbi:MAG: FG-GAP-like repeat-containing protein [Pseudomonadota bacterium]
MIRLAYFLVFSLSLSFFGNTAFADLPQRNGWPITVAPGLAGQYLLAPRDGVAVFDLIGDSKLEIVASSGDQVFVWDINSTACAGWPQTVQGTAQPPPSIGDIDGDGDFEIVQAARGLKYSDTSYVYVFHHDGNLVAGWPIAFPNLIFHAISLADLDGNGTQDLIIQIGKWPPAGTLLVLSGDGTALGSNWEHELESYPLAPAAVGDIDGDGSLEIAYLTLGNLNVRRCDGTAFPAFPLAANNGKEYAGGVVLADLDPNNTGLEIITCDKDISEGTTKVRLLAFSSNGEALPGFPVVIAEDVYGVSAPTVGDMDDDTTLEIVLNVRGKGIFVVDNLGTLKTPPIATLSDSTASIQIADLDGDNELEIVADNNTTNKTGQGFVEAYNIDGTPIENFPLFPLGSTMANTATIADLDGDNVLELVIPSVALSGILNSWVNVWTVPKSKLAPTAWTTFGFNARRANCSNCAMSSSIPWRADAGPSDIGHDSLADNSVQDSRLSNGDFPLNDDQGCGCSIENTRGNTAINICFLLLLCFYFKRLSF